jgi:hypothetical protein
MRHLVKTRILADDKPTTRCRRPETVTHLKTFSGADHGRSGFQRVIDCVSGGPIIGYLNKFNVENHIFI